jgi:hypothetical protein
MLASTGHLRLRDFKPMTHDRTAREIIYAGMAWPVQEFFAIFDRFKSSLRHIGQSNAEKGHRIFIA